MPIEDGACVGLPGQAVIKVTITEEELLAISGKKPSLLLVQGMDIFQVVDENGINLKEYCMFIVFN